MNNSLHIVFICGTLEPGKDGVGDYTRRLAGELIRQGAQAAVIAINDQFVNQTTESFQFDSQTAVSCLRIPAHLRIREKIRSCKNFIDDVNPNWVSLQYVPYSFHKKGIPLLLGNFLRKINPKLQWHVMVHEVCVESKGALKNKVTSFLQRACLRILKKQLNPSVFHTSIREYQKLLRAININSNLLGLFGNMTPLQFSISKNKTYRKNPLVGVYFAKVPSLQYHETFARALKIACEKYQSGIHLIFCGKSGKYGADFIENIKTVCSGLNFTISVLGELSSDEISNLFLKADFGIARVTTELLGKSGSAISMLEHGLPIWVPLSESYSMNKPFDFRPELIFTDLSLLIQSDIKNTMINRLPLIAKEFTQNLAILS